MSTLPDDVRALFAEPNFAHLATLLPDGSPHCVAVWADVEGDRVYFFTQSRTRKGRNLARDGRVALSAVDRANPYRTAHLRGRVAETVEGEDALALIDRLALKYTGAPFPMRSGTVYLVEIERAGSMTLPFREQRSV